MYSQFMMHGQKNIKLYFLKLNERQSVRKEPWPNIKLTALTSSRVTENYTEQTRQLA